jgi:hypothetical protein
MTLLRLLVFVAGLAAVAVAVVSATRSVVLPRSARDSLSWQVFGLTRRLFELRLRRSASYEERDRVMALYAPLGLLLLLPAWLAVVLAGYTLMFWSAGAGGWGEAFLLSGSSLLTLGFAPVDGLGQTLLAFSEATLGLMLVALLIAYLPTMYTAFSRREISVGMLEVRAGSPPSAVEMLARAHRLGRLDQLCDVWASWEVWFADIEETHTSLPALVFFRSPQPDRSWVTAAGAVLDAASLAAAALDTPRDTEADLCIRAGYLALRRIADYFGVAYDPDPRPGDPISIARVEFEEALDALAAQGVPLRADREAAWHDFAGWRVNYDTPLLALAAVTMAPHAPWSSDRSLLPLPRRRSPV